MSFEGEALFTQTDVNEGGAMAVLRDDPRAEGALALIEGLPPEIRTLLIGVLDELYLSDEKTLREILTLLITMHSCRTSISSALSEIVKFSDWNHRSNIRKALCDFRTESSEELTDPD